jgi:hypothetical protein
LTSNEDGERKGKRNNEVRLRRWSESEDKWREKVGQPLSQVGPAIGARLMMEETRKGEKSGPPALTGWVVMQLTEDKAREEGYRRRGQVGEGETRREGSPPTRSDFVKLLFKKSEDEREEKQWFSQNQPPSLSGWGLIGSTGDGAWTRRWVNHSGRMCIWWRLDGEGAGGKVVRLDHCPHVLGQRSASLEANGR